MLKYTPNPPDVAQAMLQAIGLKSMDDLFQDIKDEIRFTGTLNIGEGMGEMEIRQNLNQLAAKNINVNDFPCFLGAGAYDHYIPAAVEQLLLRSEFYTAYTPYQPEISQGILQSIFEYQSMICKLTGMYVSNASMYDGGSALAEACNLACVSSKNRKKVVIPDTVHPEYLEILKTYSLSGNLDVIIVPGKDGIADLEAMAKVIDKDTACVVIQQPNFWGLLEEVAPVEKLIHENQGLLVMAVEPISLALLKSPGEWGADIAVGEGQPLGNSLSFGGPYLGFFAARQNLMRKMPGRIVGQTADWDGRKSFVLTLQAREQHIRREKAISNICSNEALCALAASMYLTFVGEKGLKDIAMACHNRALYAQKQFNKTGLALKYDKPYFMEFAVKIDNPARANKILLENNIIGGYELEDALLFAFTEKRSPAEIDKLTAVLGGI